MKYLWTEDMGAGLHFWKLVSQLFFDNEIVIENKYLNIRIVLDVVSQRLKLEARRCGF
jgi:hypothetical protein